MSNESSTGSLSWFAGVWRTKLRSTWATTALRSPPSAADTYDQSTSISWLYRAVGELHSAIGLSLLQARRSELTDWSDCQFPGFRHTTKTILFARC